MSDPRTPGPFWNRCYGPVPDPSGPATQTPDDPRRDLLRVVGSLGSSKRQVPAIALAMARFEAAVDREARAGQQADYDALLALLHTITVAMGDRTLAYTSEAGLPMAIVFGAGSAVPSSTYEEVTDETFAGLSERLGVPIRVVAGRQA